MVNAVAGLCGVEVTLLAAVNTCWLLSVSTCPHTRFYQLPLSLQSRVDERELFLCPGDVVCDCREFPVCKVRTYDPS